MKALVFLLLSLLFLGEQGALSCPNGNIQYAISDDSNRTYFFKGNSAIQNDSCPHFHYLAKLQMQDVVFSFTLNKRSNTISKISLLASKVQRPVGGKMDSSRVNYLVSGYTIKNDSIQINFNASLMGSRSDIKFIGYMINNKISGVVSWSWWGGIPECDGTKITMPVTLTN